MAENKKDTNNLNSDKSNTYTKGLIKDYNDSYVPEGVWINAINAVTTSHKGDAGVIGNEPSNIYCFTAPYTVIVIVRRDTDTWVVFSTNDVQSEIGIFKESDCSYTKVISDKCLNFKRTNLITGHIQYNYDCTYSVFFADGLNPDRTINLDNVPYEITGYDLANPDCPIPIYSSCLDCEKIRLNYLTDPPCCNVKKAKGAGSLLNGSYQVVVAYTINAQRVTNYFTPSNIVGLWDHGGIGGGLEITITNLDVRFEEYELVIISTVNSQTTARKLGYYNINQNTVYVDAYNESLPSVDISLISLVTPVYEKCDKMFALNGYLLRSGVYSKYDFNYQPLANQITTYWQEVQYPADYYFKGGTNTSYLRDEQYCFFIRWLYNDGDKSASYHIPGRSANSTDFQIRTGPDVLFGDNLEWQVYNTATVTNSNVNSALADGGIVLREGLMGYWESSERYPINRPEVWGDLCGVPIRHHKFPDNGVTHIHNQGGDKINILGVRFDNIKHPVDNNGNLISNIIGYEILRGSREGNRTIIAKGLLNNMRIYKNPDGKEVLYQNYPYNSLKADYFLRQSLANGGESPDNDGQALTGYKRDYYSFHSPDTNFNRPFLNINEVRLYTKQYGSTAGRFDYVYGHPKQKLITNTSYLIALFLGIGISLRAAFGNRNIEKTADDVTAMAGAGLIASSYGFAGVNAGAVGALASRLGLAPTAISSGNYGGFLAGTTSGAHGGNWGGIQFPSVVETGGDLSRLNFGSLFPGSMTKPGRVAVELADYALYITTIAYWAGLGLDAALNIIYQLIPFTKYALQFNSHGFYDKYKPIGLQYPNTIGHVRREHDLSLYINNQLQTFDATYNINNLYRNNYVGVKIKGTFQDVSTGEPSLVDNSQKRVRDSNAVSFNNPINGTVTATTSAYYAGLKVDYVNQYGQLNGVVQIPIQPCYAPTSAKLPDKIYSSPTLFGGDIYINRYTEKNPFFYFVEWLYDFPDGTPFDYSQYSNQFYPRYWANFEKFDRSDIQTPLSWGAIKSFAGGNLSNALLDWTKAASQYHHLDRNVSTTNSFIVTSAWFYLFNNGVRDFFVESEVNLAFRDYGEINSERHYDKYSYTDLNAMFRSDIIKSGNYYKYDYSLSVSKLLNQYKSFSVILPRSYDPAVAETCYSYYPSTVYYSLPQRSEQQRDAWRIYLVNNYKDFEFVISSIKPINRTGAIILFQDAEPTSITGVDQLETGLGTKITIGDGGLFAQPFQALVNADDEFEYGSCQDTRSVVNTPYGMFYMSRANGKIMQYMGGQLIDISMNGMRYWFMEHLPYVLTTQFPEFDLIENTVVGIGCQVVYDPQYELVYFCKRDFKAIATVFYDVGGKFWYIQRQSGTEKIQLGDPKYFENCSWTISYDPKTKMWLSFHDWHPNFVLGINDHFYSVKDQTFWKHNDTCNSFCNYYGIDHPFEVEFPVNTGSTITTIKNIEYTLEVLNYSTDCIDPYHVLDANFDYAMLYNTEQNSGLLKLNLKPYSPVKMLEYPKILPNQIEILYSKEENKYRFNQFWDSTKDRGEFTGNQWRMFNTEQNGYRKVLNPTFIDYLKPPLQRKKFRHYGNRLILGKTVSNNLKYNLKVVNTKETFSPR